MNWLRSIVVGLALVGGVAFGGDKVIINPAVDGDIVVKVNDGGVIKEVIRVTGSEGKVEFPGVTPGQFAVGSVQMSLLTLGQFQAIMGTTDWVEMNGQNVSGSVYHTITGNITVPDATGRFLRNTGGAAGGLGAQQGQTTAPNGLSNSSTAHTHNASSVSGGTGGESGHSHSSGSATYNGRSGTAIGGSNPDVDYVNRGVIPSTGGSSGHTHGISGTAAGQGGGSHSHTISGDAETRPINVAVNYYIKIN